MDSSHASSDPKENLPSIFIIGVDGGTFEIIDQGVKEGKLPTFKKLMEKGTYGKLESVIQPLTAPAWASFLTGQNPGKHGIFDFYIQRKESYERRPVNAGDIPTKTFYEILSDNKRKVCIINVPMTYPPKKVNGYVISGMLTPKGRRYAFPPNLQKELYSLDYEIEIGEAYSGHNKESFVRNIEKLLKQRKKTLFYLIDKEEWDLLVCVFRGTDIISHAFWGNKDAILKEYKKIDDILKDLLQRIDENVILIVMSDHGFGQEKRVVHLNTWLVQQGLLHFISATKTSLKKLLFHHNFTPDRIWELVSKTRTLYKLVAKDLGTRNLMASHFFLSYSDVDWKKTLAYAFGSVGSWGLIYINKEGKTPQGTVKPGKECENLKLKLTNKLFQLRDTETGEKVVDKIYQKERIYSGKFVENAPDIIVKWEDGYITYPFFAGGGKIFTDSPQTRTGNHRMYGILFVHGPNVVENKIIKEARIIDLAPTILHIMKTPIPRDMDGRVLKEVFEKNSEYAKRKITYEEANKEKERIMKKIKRLKYRAH